MRTTPPASPLTRNGEVLGLVLHVLDALAHEALDRIDGALRVGQQPALRLAADVDRAVVAERDDRRHQRRRRSRRGSRPARRPSRRRRGCWWCRDRCRRLCSCRVLHRGLERSASGQLAFDAGQQVVDVVALEHPLAQRVEHRRAVRRRGAVASTSASQRADSVAQLRLVRVALRLDRRARALEPRLPLARPARRSRAARGSRRAPRSARTLPRAAPAAPACAASCGSADAPALRAAAGTRRASPGSCSVRYASFRYDERSRLARRSAGRRVVEVVGMELPAQLAEAPLEIGGVEIQLARQAEEREVVAVPAERQDLRALRTEVRVDRRAAAALATRLEACGAESIEEAILRRASGAERAAAAAGRSSRSGC